MKEIMQLENGIGYSTKYSESYQLHVLGFFLSIEMVSSFSYDLFYAWMKNPNEKYTGGNLTDLEKIGDNVIITLEFDYELYEKDPEKYSLTISLDQLISVSEQWRQIIKNKPPFIIITEDNGMYTITASQE